MVNLVSVNGCEFNFLVLKSIVHLARFCYISARSEFSLFPNAQLCKERAFYHASLF